jgi:hypothetical protein
VADAVVETAGAGRTWGAGDGKGWERSYRAIGRSGRTVTRGPEGGDRSKTHPRACLPRPTSWGELTGAGADRPQLPRRDPGSLPFARPRGLDEIEHVHRTRPCYKNHPQNSEIGRLRAHHTPNTTTLSGSRVALRIFRGSERIVRVGLRRERVTLRGGTHGGAGALATVAGLVVGADGGVVVHQAVSSASPRSAGDRHPQPRALGAP